MSNAIALENAKQGNPESEWGLVNGASRSIEGFAADMSYNLGQSVDFKINTAASSYRIDIYRMGYYGGRDARWKGEGGGKSAAPPERGRISPQLRI